MTGETVGLARDLVSDAVFGVEPRNDGPTVVTGRAGLLHGEDLARPFDLPSIPVEKEKIRYVHNVLIVNQGLAQIRTSVHVVEQVDHLDLGGVTLKHIDDPVAFSIRLDDGDEFEIAIDRAVNPVPVAAEA